MDFVRAIQNYAAQPLSHQVLLSILKDYKRPNDKVYELIKSGMLLSIKKGLYIAGPSVHSQKPEPFLIANHLLGPSYVSLDSALSYHGLIPERIYEISSVTTKASRKFTTPVGNFTYTNLQLPYYSFGIQQLRLGDEQNAMIASPEKALLDKVVTTPGIILRSQKNAFEYLVENLRIDEDSLKKLNTRWMSEWIPEAPKKSSILNIIKMIDGL